MTDSYIKEGEGLPDFILLTELTEDALFANLKTRYDKDIIYTYIGNVVVSVNPYKQLPIYSPEVTKRYNGRYPYENDPHIFALADMSYRQLLQSKTNQAVIISGESGAGKTEASKQVMRYIADVTPTSKAQDMIKIKDQLLDSNPILEAFGNAKTLRNDNSSRFGKYMQIQFDGAGFPVGGVINVYLLEKSRVVTRADGEKAFHIFYELLKGADDSLLSSLSLERDVDKYAFLADSDPSSTIPFSTITSAMKTLSFPEDATSAIWHALAAILHLGQVRFTETQSTGDDKGDSSGVENKDAVVTAARLLSTDAALLEKSLTSRTVKSKTESLVKPLSKAQARFARDALCKSLYERVFLRVVTLINATIENSTPAALSGFRIGLLDIYGFEVFEHNSFEQLCINWTNEKLQQVFIERTLKQEQEEYEREGIEWTPVEYFNNKVICDLIEAKPEGIIAILDEACLMTKTEALFLKNIGDTFAKHSHYDDYNKSKSQKLSSTSFMLKHYAGDVVYDVTGFLDKNNDELYRDLQLALQASSDAFLAALFPKSLEEDEKKRPDTAGTQFRRSVNALVDELMACEPHYVRCVKPNDEKAADKIDEERVRHQIRYLGLLENVRVRRAGFAYRAEYERFVQRYKMINDATWPLPATDVARDTAALIVGTEADHRLGKTKIFLKDPKTLFSLEERRQAALPAIVVGLQSAWRAYVARVKYAPDVSALRVQKYLRAWIERGRYARLRAATAVQKYLRRWLAVVAYERRRAATLVQKFARRWLAVTAYKRLRAATIVQKYARGWIERTAWETRRDELRKKAAGKVILASMHRVLARRYFMNKVYKPLKDVSQDPRLGVDVHWGKPSPTLRDAERLMRVMFEFWRARTLIARVPEGAARDELKLKMAAYDLFHGHRPWLPSQRYTKTMYVDGGSEREAAVSAKVPPEDTTGVRFAVEAIKIGKTGKLQPRVLVFTETHLYKLDGKNLKEHKPAVPLSALSAVVLSTRGDQFVVFKFDAPEKDVVANLGVPSATDDRVAHLVTVLKAARGDGMRVDFATANSVVAEQARPKELKSTFEFADAPETPPGASESGWGVATFAKAKAKNTYTVSAPASQPGFAVPGAFEPVKRSRSFLGAKSYKKGKSRGGSKIARSSSSKMKKSSSSKRRKAKKAEA